MSFFSDIGNSISDVFKDVGNAAVDLSKGRVGPALGDISPFKGHFYDSGIGSLIPTMVGSYLGGPIGAGISNEMKGETRGQNGLASFAKGYIPSAIFSLATGGGNLGFGDFAGGSPVSGAPSAPVYALDMTQSNTGLSGATELSAPAGVDSPGGGTGAAASSITGPEGGSPAPTIPGAPAAGVSSTASTPPATATPGGVSPAAAVPGTTPTAPSTGLAATLKDLIPSTKEAVGMAKSAVLPAAVLALSMKQQPGVQQQQYLQQEQAMQQQALQQMQDAAAGRVNPQQQAMIDQFKNQAAAVAQQSLAAAGIQPGSSAYINAMNNIQSQVPQMINQFASQNMSAAQTQLGISDQATQNLINQQTAQSNAAQSAFSDFITNYMRMLGIQAYQQANPPKA